MILFIFNNFFPDNSGFSLRCKRAIDALSQVDDIAILCRENAGQKYLYKSQNKNIPIYTFKPLSSHIDIPQNYVSGIYEIIRNIDLLIQLGFSTFKLFYKYRNNNLKIYAVTSPLTVPFIVLILGKIFNISLEIVEFHDLEPELALHIKHISQNNLIYKIEILLEKIVCKSFNKIIVTTESQAARLFLRTNVPQSHFCVIFNTVELLHQSNASTVNLKIRADDFNVGYFSTFSYEFTTSGIIKLIDRINSLAEIKNLKIFLVGDGPGIPKVVTAIKKNGVEKKIYVLGKRNDYHAILNKMDVCLIPWDKNSMTETMIPTKLFEYMANSKAIIAPNYGEFKKILSHNNDCLLYDKPQSLLRYIIDLQNDNKKRKKIGLNAYKKYMKYYNSAIYSEKIKKFISQ